VGEASIIYVALDTNKIYRWGGSSYVEISSSLALGTTASTAFPGDRGLATETKTDNIVSGVQGLTDTRITNSAIAVQPLIVNGITGTTTNLQEWQLNGALNARITSAGNIVGQAIYGTQVGNLTGTNATIFFGSTGTLIERNVADANHALRVNQANASSTGDILRLQSAGANVLEITRTGGLNQNNERLFSNFGTQNTFFGILSGTTNLTGSENTGIGRSALNAITTGSANTAVGRSSLLLLTTGGTNTAIGGESGRTITTGGGNTFVGYTAGFNASQLATASNSTALGNAAFTDKSNQMVFGNASVSEFKFDRNTSAVLLAPRIENVSSSSNIFKVTTLTNNAMVENINLISNTSGSIADGFGSSTNFYISLSDASLTRIGSIGATRSGAGSGRLTFLTNNAGSMTEKMTILPNGNVGIGTASPVRLLSLTTSSNDDGIQIRRNSVTTNDYAVLGFRINTSELVGNFAEIRGVRTNRATAADTDLSFHTITGGTLGERLRIRDDGLVGINETFAGVTPPNGQLVVKSGATNRIPLIVDTLSGHTVDLLRLSVNGSNVAGFTANGELRTTAVRRFGQQANASLYLNTNGPLIQRDVADSNPALIVNLDNAGSSGHIQVWQSETDAKAHITRTGIFVGQSRPTRTDITANATLALGDEGKVLRVNPTTAADNITITIPKNSAVAFPVDTEIAIVRYNSGTVSIAPVDGDVTLQSANAERKIRNRYASVALKKIGTNEWVLVGSLEA
jgi:hypothetical protein